MKTLITILFTSFMLFAISNKAVSQTATTYPKGRFLTKNGKKISFYSLVLDGNIYKFQPKRNDEYQDVAADNIMRIDKETGNGAVIGFVSGAGLGLLVGFVDVAGGNSDLGSLGGVSSSTKTITIAASTTICALVGLLVGNGQKRYETVYRNPNLNSGLNPNFNFNVVFSNNVKGLSVRFAF
jgi:hypothetical protein